MERRLKITVVDMQPITPAVGGGRQRLLGLYHALGDNIQCTYVGSYDWPGEPYRDQQISPGLREIVVPLSPEHHAAAAELSQQLDGRVVIDIAFADQAHLSPDYLRVAREHIADADVVVFSHPWCFPPLAGALTAHQLVVYDSQNVEAVLRTSLLDNLPEAAPLLRSVVEAEYSLCNRADLVLACSRADSEIFQRVFSTGWDKLRIVPNGIFAFDHAPPSREGRTRAKQGLGIGHGTLVLFLGSGYGPNNDAALHIATQLAPRMPNIGFAIVGGCGDNLTDKTLGRNVYVPGIVDETRKREWMVATDIAINPITEGSGTCIKMFDYMAEKLPVVSTAIGARGILQGASPALLICDLDAFPEHLMQLASDREQSEALAESGRQLVEQCYAWERISPNLGVLLAGTADRTTAPPYFTVVIPTYERHAQLDSLMAQLDAQTLSDFEVIVVDQSASIWAHSGKTHAFALRYIHSPVKGAVSARNLGGFLARGTVIAFTDDDCQPRPDWLANAVRWFRNPTVVGLEGFIRSDHLDDPDWRPVTNIGCIGIGFMTANLLVRNAAFQQIGGFDIAFDRPHFREDTDLGWRLQELGKVPFAPDVEVLHPAQPRAIKRESTEERGKFFVKDALLLRKHPARYAELFLAEGHYSHTEGFWKNLTRGLKMYDVEMPAWMVQYTNRAGMAETGAGGPGP